jgi:hypothetical protein
MRHGAEPIRQTVVMAELEVLVSVPTGDGIAGVLRDEDGAVWLSWRIDGLGGPRLDDYRPSHVGLGDDRTLIGGRLPRGAVGAEVVDDAGRRIAAAVGGGAWAAVLEQPVRGPIAPAWWWDADRRPLAAPLRADWPRTRVTDASEPCPACGGPIWDQVTATDDSRRMRGTGSAPSTPPPVVDHYHGMEPTPFVVWCACGHEESIGALMRMTTASDADAVENKRRHEQARRKIQERQRKTLEKAGFPVYADRSSTAVMCGSGTSGAITHGVKVRHGARAHQTGPALQIETSHITCHHDSEYADAYDELERWLRAPGADLPTNRSDAGLTIAWRTHDRERRRLAASADPHEILIRVDGIAEPFTCVQSEEQWAAVRHRDSMGVTIVGRVTDPASLDLGQLRDPVSELDWDQWP